MAKKIIKPEINLLPQEEFEASTLGRTLKWLLTTFRYIVIGTEMVVMIAFLSRFWLDAQSADLINAINQKKSVIASYSGFEKQFRSVQDKLKIFNSFNSSNQKVTPIIQKISTIIPADITLTSLAIDKSKITIIASTQNEASAVNFVASLNNSGVISAASVSSIESRAGNENITFTVTAVVLERSNGGKS